MGLCEHPLPSPISTVIAATSAAVYAIITAATLIMPTVWMVTTISTPVTVVMAISVALVMPTQTTESVALALGLGLVLIFRCPPLR